MLIHITSKALSHEQSRSNLSNLKLKPFDLWFKFPHLEVEELFHPFCLEHYHCYIRDLYEALKSHQMYNFRTLEIQKRCGINIHMN